VLDDLPPATTAFLLAAVPTESPEANELQVRDLSEVEAFADMPEDTRVAFEREAKIHELNTDEEVAGFALAHVVEGDVAVMAMVSDIPAVRLEAGAVLRSRGSVDERVPLRLVCTSDSARVLTWSDDVVARSFQALPWVEDELREQANRAHALIGVTLGPLGEAYGQSMLDQVTSRLEPRYYMEGETIVSYGEPVPGLLILGVGNLDVLGQGGEVQDSLDVGTILFPGASLAMESAPATAQAGKGGAVVLMADLPTAQEMIITFPPLLEELSRS